MQREHMMQRSSSSTMRSPMSTRFGFFTFLLNEAAVGVAVLDRILLQLAFARLVANRAIERMIDEQKFHHALAAFLNQRRGGANRRAFADLRGATNGGARNPVNFWTTIGGQHGRP